jgi:formylglycine-generating enzyme required for sulfatase activity
VRILNIKPRFQQGIELDPGEYLIEVSAGGYITHKERVTIHAGETKTLSVALEKIQRLLTNSLYMTFVLIEPGTFTMGTPRDKAYRSEDEVPRKIALTKGFYMQSTEVTVGQYQTFIQATGYRTQAETSGGCFAQTPGGKWVKQKGIKWDRTGVENTADHFLSDHHPVSCVSWNDALAFVEWLSKKEGRAYDLPTEAQWEYACRAGSDAPFAFGECLSTRQANYGGMGNLFASCTAEFEKKRADPIAAGQLEANVWGLHDMHGNVAEWCRDWYGSYPSGFTKDPDGPAQGVERVIRGGSFSDDANRCRSAKRSQFGPEMASRVIGFRVVLRP